MLQMSWTDEYEVDGGVIDKEHQSLVELANRVFRMASREVDSSALIEVVKALFRYMEYHFRHEEKLMIECGYPALVEHTQCHRRIVDEMTSSLRATKDIRQYAVKLRYLMVDWVVAHMINEDKKIGAHIRESQTAEPSPVTAGGTGSE